MSTSAIDGMSTVKRALVEIRSLKSQLQAVQAERHEPIAIVGLGFRFPGGCNDSDSYWKLLSEGRCAISEIPSCRWKIADYYDPDPDCPGKMYARHGGFLDSVDEFDADLFGISPREATTMDPQQRLMLEVAWEAIENAGYNPDRLARTSAAVYFGLSNSDYSRLVFRDANRLDAYASTGTLFCVAAGRLSHLLGIEGPSLVIDTACSSSLVALHLAVRSLRAKECDLALAGGVTLILTPEIHINFSKSRMLSPNGLCKTFDASADGYVRAEGCGVVVLKRLSEALAARDHIWAVVRGTAVNQDGRSGGLTVPNGRAQEAVVRQALADARLAPETISYIEAHGTGTGLGDPIEMHALAAVFGQRQHPLVVGSVKTNLGHTESAAGVAGLIKTVLGLAREWIPAHLHFRQLNPHIQLGEAPLEVAATGRPWPRGAVPRRAGVSSFGFSGTNAHVIVEEAPEPVTRQREGDRPLHVLCLSARSEQGIAELQRRYAEHLREHPALEGADVCYTANTGRAAATQRRVWIGPDTTTLRQGVEQGAAAAQGQARSGQRVAFLFPGQGAQYGGMGQQLYATQPVFREAVDECRELLRGVLDRDVVAVLWGEDSAALGQTRYTQPALFVVEWALARLWASWGVEAAWVLGHSVGEYVAACVAGLWSVEDGIRLVAERGRLMEAHGGGGAMVAVEATRAEAAGWLTATPALSLAAENGPTSLVISGAVAEIERLEQRLRAQGRRTVRLAVSEAFHSSLMDAMVGELSARADRVRWGTMQTGLVSSLSGEVAQQATLATGSYWGRQARATVQFRRAMATLAAQGCTAYVEVGPGTTLLSLGQQCVGEAEAVWVASVRRQRGEWQQVLESVGQLWTRGVAVDWEGFDRPYARRRLPLPPSPFARQRFWVAPQAPTPATEPEPWETICAVGHQQAEFAPLDLGVADYSSKWAVLHDVTQGAIARCLRDLGLFCQPDETLSVEQALRKGRITATYSHLVARWLSLLANGGLLERCGPETFRSPTALPELQLKPLFESASVFLKNEPGIFEYAIACADRLNEIVTGRLSPLELLFPAGGFERTEKLYHHSPLARYLHAIAGAVVKQIVQSAPSDCQFRILEVGGGTGAMTTALLPTLPRERTTYIFTDVSRLFLNKTTEKFASFEFMHYELMDLEQEPAEQGFADSSIDVIVASNVLHATRNLHITLQRLRKLLRPGGFLLLQEVTNYLSWFDITVALIEAWDIFEDDLRCDHPMLSAAQWRDLLSDTGFVRSESFPKSGSAAEVLGQHIILARVPGRFGESVTLIEKLECHSSRPLQVPSQEDGRVDKVKNMLASAALIERAEILVDVVRAEVSRILQLPAAQTPSRDARLMDLGLDSLMTLELRDRLEKVLTLDEPLTSTLVFDHPTIAAIACHLESRLFPEGTEADERTVETRQPLADTIVTMSEEQAEALLYRKLQTL